MKNCLYILIALLMAAPLKASPSTHVLSFRVWKQKKVDEARSLVNELKREIRRVSVPKTQDEIEEKDSLTRRISQAELNLGVVRDLSANDYFVLYVVPQFKDDYQALKTAARTLNPRDMADILSAYERRIEAPAQAEDVYGAKNDGGLDPSTL